MVIASLLVILMALEGGAGFGLAATRAFVHVRRPKARR
jgi:hypothetical protein